MHGSGTGRYGKETRLTVKLVNLQKKLCGLTYLNEIGEKKKEYPGALQNYVFIFHLLVVFAASMGFLTSIRL